MDFIMQMRPSYGKEEKKALAEYMDEGGFITEFKRTELFEKMLANFTGAKHCIVVNNGTVSLTLAAIASGIQRGDEVIVPNYTMIATPNSIKLIGGTPVFVDVEPDTLCLDISLVKKAITPKTKAIFLVSANGRYPLATIKAFENIAKENKLILLEDAAQALGSYYPDGRHIGRAGIIGSFSFSMPKIISTGQGGALITDDDTMAMKLRKLKDFGRTAGGSDLHDTIGYNFKFTELQACIGLEQVKKLPDRIVRKKELYDRYLNGLNSISEIKLFTHNLKNTSPWFFDVMADNRDELMIYLKDKGVGTRVMYPPINQQKAYGEEGSFPVAEEVGLRGLWLPSMVQLKNEEVDYICKEIRSFYLRD